MSDLQTVSSDHAPYRLDADGKYPSGEASTFKEIANGMPGSRRASPPLRRHGVEGAAGLEEFVEVTATAPAHIYNLSRKGSIAVGMDADIAIWDPDRVVTIEDAMMHDRAGYSPYAGRQLRGWPAQVLSRGRLVIEGGALKVDKGTGKFLARDGGEAATPAHDAVDGRAATWRSYVL